MTVHELITSIYDDSKSPTSAPINVPSPQINSRDLVLLGLYWAGRVLLHAKRDN
jgi:hypothetical protein